MDISILNNAKKVHFIGIGGIGISAIVRMLLSQGKEVTGSDISSSEITKSLEKLGAKIFYKQEAENVSEDCELVIYTVALPENNPELVKAKELGIPILSYPEVLGLISANKFTIAVAGTHGKTTTTAMIGKILIDAGLDPTVIIGSLIKDSSGNQTNFISGKGEYLVVEACEYRRSFLQINPKVIVITNIDDDHLDYYKDIEGVKQGFLDFVEKLPEDGIVVTNLSLPNVKSVEEKISKKIVDYSSTQTDIKLKVPGVHNVENAKAAFAVAKLLKISDEQILKSLSEFAGTWRRFEYRGRTEKGVEVYDDYAHHPTEIKATLQAAKDKFPDKKLTVIFQPHLYSRTKEHFGEFPEAFSLADKVILAPIYAAREQVDPTVSAELLAEKINKTSQKALHFSSFNDIQSYIDSNTKSGEVVLTMGAGDIYHVGDALVSQN